MSEKLDTTKTILRRVRVQTITGLSRSSIYKLMQEGDFPKQVSLSRDGRAVGWRSDDIEQWLESRQTKSSPIQIPLISQPNPEPKTT